MIFTKRKKCPSCHKKQAIEYVASNKTGKCKYCGAGFNNKFHKTQQKELLQKQSQFASLKEKLVSA